MDHNLDLLKSDKHAPTCKFLDALLDANMLPTITRPTRIMQSSATLIDNIFISEQLQCNFDSAILTDNISDHLPCITLLRQTRISSKSPLEFKRRNLNAKKLTKSKKL